MEYLPTSFLSTRRHWRKVQGFTLVELLVVMVITGILTMAAIPMFDGYMARSAMNTHISALASTFRLARAEAIKRNAPVTICTTKTPMATEPSCLDQQDADTGWATGWIVFLDFNSDGQFDKDTETVLARQDAIPNSGGIMANPSDHKVTFLANGLAVGAAANFTFIPKGQADNEDAQQLMCVSMQGLTRLSSDKKC